MPSKKQYNLVNDDAYDSRIPLHSEEAFQHGINFHAKYIGTLDVPRPSSRVEIVAAMRRIRYEFKAKAIKKKKVTITISVEGVKVILRKKKKKSQWNWDDSRFLVMTHPIYRIFYVSHDSQDLKIFSYIARDGGSNVFKCNVFKSSKKSQAMRIVRTVGQAFEVCHKLSLTHATSSLNGQDDDQISSEKSQDVSTEITQKGSYQSGAEHDYTSSQKKADSIAHPLSTCDTLSNNNPEGGGETFSSPLSDLLAGSTALKEGAPLGMFHQVQLLREQLDQQSQQTQSATSQLQLLKDQLSAETAARLEAQTQNSQLLQHNKELLEHIRVLVKHIQDLEDKLKLGTLERRGNSIFPDLYPLPQASNTSQHTTPSPGSLQLPDFSDNSSSQNPGLGRSNSANYPSSSAEAWLKRSFGKSGSPCGQNEGGLSLPSSPTVHPSRSNSSTASNLEELFQNAEVTPRSNFLPRLNPPPTRSRSAKGVEVKADDWSTSPSLLGHFSLPVAPQESARNGDISQALRDLTKLNLFDKNTRLYTETNMSNRS